MSTSLRLGGNEGRVSASYLNPLDHEDRESAARELKE
jgi:hypothetical protein